MKKMFPARSLAKRFIGLVLMVSMLTMCVGMNDEPDAEDTDNWALNHGYIAITPTQIDVTAYEMLAKMKDWEQ